MTAEAPVLLLDTNVWLDCYLEFRSGHAAAESLLRFADEANVAVSYVSTSAKDVFYLVCGEVKRLAREKKGGLSEEDALAARSIAWSCVRNMAENAVAVPVGEPQVWLASHYKGIHDDFEDDLLLAALETSKADFLVTGDEVLRRKAPLGAFDSAGMLEHLRLREAAGL